MMPACKCARSFVSICAAWLSALLTGTKRMPGRLIASQIAGLLLYLNRAAVIAGSLAWAIHEVGFDWWQLAPRGGLLIVLGLLLLMLWVTRSWLDRHGGWRCGHCLCAVLELSLSRRHT